MISADDVQDKVQTPSLATDLLTEVASAVTADDVDLFAGSSKNYDLCDPHERRIQRICKTIIRRDRNNKKLNT
ncbi:unnamed protein product [Macrosiphum euphorbiae]|uniref:Uncharacterized protein n=1 Tax=Macrosiphum euphorbiae TaxID=13131 RepID=A0AAV0WX11_9HEMI|nr:unnamed protein product [Macrosiphum euphorbiae]